MPTPPRFSPRAAAPTLCAALCASALLAAPAASAAEISVAVSIAPAHSLTAMVAGERAEATLLVPPGASPHDFALRPSAARALAEADVVIGVGAGLDGFLDAPIRALGEDARILVLSAAPGVTLLPIRESVLWEAEGHHTEHHADHDERHDAETHAQHMADPGHRAVHEAVHGDDHDEAHDEAHAGEHDEIHGDDHSDDHGDDHGHHHAHAHPEGAADPHIWLDPQNARAWLAAIADALSVADPEGAPAYAANAAAADARIDALEAELQARLAPVADRPYAVFHDAYQYFERRFGLAALGAVSGVDAAAPSPRRLSGIRAAIRDSGAVCVFSEPQFDPALIKVAVEGTDVRIATLDPLGASIPAGPDQYPLLMEALAANVADCLGGG